MSARWTALLIVALIGSAACSGPSTVPTPQEPAQTDPEEPEVGEVQEVRQAHSGPLDVDPEEYDCGHLPDYVVCEFDCRLTNNGETPLVIDRVGQDFSPYAQIGLVENQTAFERDLPYEMAPDEVLRLLFFYRRDDREEMGGSLVVNYHVGDTEYELLVPVTAE